MSNIYRTHSKPYDCAVTVHFPMDLLEDIQAKADATRKNPETLILEACAEMCERSYRQIEMEHDCQTLGLSRTDLRKLLGVALESNVPSSTKLTSLCS